MTWSERQVVTTVRRLHLRELRQWVRKGWVRPADGDTGPTFDDLDIARIRLICDLKKDMSVSPDAIPMILSLLDQIHGLRHELRSLLAVIESQPDDVRAQLHSALGKNETVK